MRGPAIPLGLVPRAPEAETRALLIALNADERFSRAAICRLALDRERWLHSDPAVAADRLGLRDGSVRRALDLAPRAPRVAAAEERRARDAGAAIVTLQDPAYPEALRDLALPPPVLYCLGEIPTRPAVAIVGSRRADPYGLEVAELFARELARCGATVVSGLARGVDTAAHRGALAAAGGRTVAVLGCGIDITYPWGSARLAETIATRGAVLSEFPFQTPPRRRNFPIRNRIIAALAAGVLIVRAAPRSGSLITARHALELGRDVFAVPGRIFEERAQGPNWLIRDGALLVQHPREILEALPLALRDRLAKDAVTREELAPPLEPPLLELLEALPTAEMVSLDRLVAEVDLSVDRALAALLELELGGWIRRHPGPAFSRRAAL